MSDGTALTSTSPYSTGGGGTVLEHHYGAVLLSHLLTGAPVPGLGDHVTPVEVRFQARSVTAVDDFLVTGRAGNGAMHRLSVAVRRNPRLTPGDDPSTALLGTFLTTLENEWPRLHAGRWHLALAVAAPFTQATALQALTTAAAAAGSYPVFRARATEPGQLNATATRMLERLQRLVSAAVDGGAPDSGVPVSDLTWRLLAHLSVLDLRLEGIRPADRTAAVERLQRMATKEGVANGDALFSRLRELASGFAPAGATVTKESLRTALCGLPFVSEDAPVPAHPRPRRAASSGLPRVLWTHSRLLRPGASQPRLHGDTLLLPDGYVLHAFDRASGTPLWQAQTGYGNPPPVDGSTVFTSGLGNVLRPRDLRTGVERSWPAGRCAADKVVCENGTLYVPGLDGGLYAYDTASAKRLWAFPAFAGAGTIRETPRVVTDIVFTAVSGSQAEASWLLFALDAETGRPRWPDSIQLSPPKWWLATERAVHVLHPCSDDHAFQLATFDVGDGALLWRERISEQPAAAPVVTQGALYLTQHGGVVSSWDAITGSLRWTVRVADRITTSPVATPDRLLVTSWSPGRITALDPRTGTTVWKHSSRPAAAFASPAFPTETGAWAVSRAGVLQGWDLDSGKRIPGPHKDLLWNPATQGDPEMRDGNLYAATGDGSLHAIRLMYVP